MSIPGCVEPNERAKGCHTPCPLVVQGRWPKKQNMTNLSMHKDKENKVRAHTSLALMYRQEYITFYVVFNPLDEYQKQQFFCLNLKFYLQLPKIQVFLLKNLRVLKTINVLLPQIQWWRADMPKSSFCSVKISAMFVFPLGRSVELIITYTSYFCFKD